MLRGVHQGGEPPCGSLTEQRVDGLWCGGLGRRAHFAEASPARGRHAAELRVRGLIDAARPESERHERHDAAPGARGGIEEVGRVLLGERRVAPPEPACNGDINARRIHRFEQRLGIDHLRRGLPIEFGERGFERDEPSAARDHARREDMGVDIDDHPGHRRHTRGQAHGPIDDDARL